MAGPGLVEWMDGTWLIGYPLTASHAAALDTEISALDAGFYRRFIGGITAVVFPWATEKQYNVMKVVPHENL
jgi:hypothetical protein